MIESTVKQNVEFEYYFNSLGQVVINKYIGKEKSAIKIPERIDDVVVTTIGENAFFGNTELVTLELSSSISSIENNAFHGCKNIEKITFPKSIWKIGEAAFAECFSLENVVIPSEGVNLEKNAFTICGISHAEIGKIESIDKEAFSLCSRLKTVKIKKVDRIPGNTFLHCINLSDVILETKECVVDPTAFAGCRRFEQIKFEKWNFADTMMDTFE